MTAAAAPLDAATPDQWPAQPPAAPERRLRVIVRPAPRREPPFDDELEQGPAAGAWDRQLPFPPSVSPPCPVPAPARRDALPQPGAWGRRLLVGLIECAAGRRALQQFGPMLSFSVGRGLAAEFERAAKLGARHWLQNAAVRTVRASEPADGVAELSATVDCGERVRAVALRVERHQGRWRCTRLQLG
jgi:uncharacterized protein DUF6459